jgi:hypothetical protein
MIYASQSDQIMRYSDEVGSFLDSFLAIDPDFIRRVKS